MAGKKTSTTKAGAKPAEDTTSDSIDAELANDSIAADPDESATDQDSIPAEDTDAPQVAGANAGAEQETPSTDMNADETDPAETVPDGTGEAAETDMASQPEPEPERQTIVTEQIVERPINFIPLLLGGLLAGGVGFGAAFYGLSGGTGTDTAAMEQRLTAEVDAQETQIAALSEQIAMLAPPADISGLEATQEGLSDALGGLTDRLASLEDQISTMDARLTELEKRPISEGASDAAVAAYERELKALQDAMATQRAEIEAMTAEAARSEENAEAIARATLQRTAVSRIRTALDSGTGFADAISELESTGIEAPAPLSGVAAEGAPTLTDLQDAFPAAARAALAATRQAAAAEGEGGGFADFLKSQLGARSLEPREGNDPDAILSRAEAALHENRLQDALTEAEALPEAGRAALTDWAAEVTRRLDALAAADALGQELN